MTIARLPRALLHAEGLAVLAGAVALYLEADYGWLLFALLFLAPDLSMLAYLGGLSTGALVYDVAHTYVLAIALGVAGVLAESELATQLALIWFAHIGLDRMVGYGLKYPSGFKDTHLQRL
jgi:Domain of unknown function (DUF4260)